MTGLLIKADSFLNKYKFAFPLIIIILGLVIYFPSINTFYINDEIAFINRTKADNIFRLFSLFNFQSFDGSYYRPVGNIISGLITLITQQNLVLIRIINVLIHSLNAVFVYLLAQRLLKNLDNKKVLSAIASIIFLVHPLHDYAVIWHTALFERVMTFFYLSSLILFLNKKYFLSFSFAALAILSKEMAFSIPFIILLIASFEEKDKKRIALQTLPFFIIALLIISFRIFILNNNFITSEGTHPNPGLFTIIKNIILFGGLILFPFNADEVKELIRNNSYLIYLSLILIAFTIIFLFKKLNNKKEIFLLLIMFVLMILPASRLLMRWYDYLPSIAICILIPVMLNEIKSKRIVLVIISVFILFEVITLIIKENNWVDVSYEGKEIIEKFTQEYSNDIKNASELEFINLPAKVNEVPLFQLGFYDHMNYFLHEEKNISLFSKMYLDDFNEKIIINKNSDTLSIRLNRENYFILSHNEKYVNFNDVEKTDNLNYLYKSSTKRINILFNNGRFEKF